MPSDFGGFPAGGAPVLIDQKDGSVKFSLAEINDSGLYPNTGLVDIQRLANVAASQAFPASSAVGGNALLRVNLQYTGGATIAAGTTLADFQLNGAPAIRFLGGGGIAVTDQGASLYSYTTTGDKAFRADAASFAIVSAGPSLGSARAINFSSTANWYDTIDLILRRGAAATLHQGAANAASPVAQTLQAQGSRSGTDSNVGGANYTIQSGNGTGTGTLSSLILKSPIAVASGTGAQTQTTGLTILNGCAVFPAYAVASLPAASTVPYGRCFVTDALATLTAGIGTTVAAGGANKVPVFSDGTNWIIG